MKISIHSMYVQAKKESSKRHQEEEQAINEYQNRTRGISDHNVRALIFSEVCYKYNFRESWLINRVTI